MPGDSRYSTTNTNLAACIGSLKVPIKSEQPVTACKDETGNRKVSFWFENQGAEDFCGEIHSPLVIERAWKERESFESANPQHPLVFMRSALDKRDWLNKAWHGRIMPAASLAQAGFRTDNITLAACLMAAGVPLLRLEKPKYIFGKTSKDFLQNFMLDFEQFETPGFIDRPVSLMRRALEARSLLVTLAKDPGVETQLIFKDGHVDQDGGRMAFISEHATDEQANELLGILYNEQ